METLDIFLDTEVLRRDPTRRTGPFHALMNLALAGVVRLHISEISVREFLSSQELKIRDAEEKAKVGLRGLQRLCRAEDDRAVIQSALNGCEQAAASAIENMENQFREWLEEAGVTVNRIKPEHAERVFGDYFSGSPPFKRVKNREDIPDAFIWQAVTDLRRERPRVVLVSGDNGFAAACRSGHLGITHCLSLGELIETGELAEVLRQGLLDSQMQLAGKLFSEWVEVSSRVNELVSQELLGRRVFFFYPVEADYMVRKVERLGRFFLEGDPQYYGDGILAFPFSGRALCEVTAAISRARAENLPAEATSGLIDSGEEGFELPLLRTLVFSGALRVTVDARVLGSPVPPDQVLEELVAGEVALGSLAIHWERGGSNLPSDVFQRHAMDEVIAQIEAGDLETEIEESEEADRVSRARWFPVPEHVRLASHGGGLRFGEDARVQIAPMPRFEHWVRLLKRTLLEEGLEAGNEDTDARDEGQPGPQN